MKNKHKQRMINNYIVTSCESFIVPKEVVQTIYRGINIVNETYKISFNMKNMKFFLDNKQSNTNGVPREILEVLFGRLYNLCMNYGRRI